jgi:hypothetical protein
MLTFVGYVPVRRGLLQHLTEGRLASQEFSVFVMLLLWADHKTGIARTNAAGLHFLSGRQINHSVIQKKLVSLEEKGYIKIPFFVQGQRGDYDIFIDKFVVTEGLMKGRTLSFADTTDWKNPAYIDVTEAATEGTTDKATETADDRADVTADSNKKGKGRREKQEGNASAQTGRFAETQGDPVDPKEQVSGWIKQLDEDEHDVLPLHPVHPQQPKAIAVPPRPATPLVDPNAAMDKHAWDNEEPAGFETCNFCGVKAAVIRKTGVACVRTKGASA